MITKDVLHLSAE